MSTYTEISRLIAARGKIRDKLTSLGLATAQDKLDILAGALDGVADCGAVEKTARGRNLSDSRRIPQWRGARGWRVGRRQLRVAAKAGNA